MTAGPVPAARVDPDAAKTAPDWEEALAAAARHAPYLRRLLRQHGQAALAAGPGFADATFAAACDSARAIASDPPELAAGMAQLRIAKARCHLAVALADLCAAWPLAQVTQALTGFADLAVQAGLALAARTLAARGDIAPPEPACAAGPIPGFAVIAMGKMGAGELNYSSDIDVSLFFDPDAMAVLKGREARAVAQRVAQLLVQVLEAQTADGYVFRTDFRLRPDPGATSPAVSLPAALHYYQSIGQNWERAAFIKARACAGDGAAGAAFLAALSPFIWRRHLDFAAIADIEAIKRLIRRTHGGGEIDEPAFDVKLGVGGIRDIELFAQTQQLILGGRNPGLRLRQTGAALDALQAAGALSAQDNQALQEAYGFYRAVEHRIQMRCDEQDHATPADPAERAGVAALAGMGLAAFDQALAARRRLVATIDAALFRAGPADPDPLAALSFTGVDDHPATTAALADLGFAAPALVGAHMRAWRAGRARALRSPRAQELLQAIAPRLFRAAAAQPDPDAAFARFARLIDGLASGVQVLSLLQARPALIDDIMAAQALSPSLAERLARRPALLDCMVEARFHEPLRQTPKGALTQALSAAVAGAASFEEALNAARRFHREEALRIGLQVLKGAASAEEAGCAYADLADACVAAMATAASQETARLHGAEPGRFAVFGLGKLGGQELSEGSDLDMIVVYDAPDAARSGGARPLEATEYYTRLTQRLVAALSAPTQEGLLYEVDMQLRPSGSKGPVAVRLSSFTRYYWEEAWTWELLALTRLRPVAGDAALIAETMAAARRALAKPRAPEALRQDAAAMRALMARERPPGGPWDLKLMPGGLVDLEFIVQTLQICASPGAPDLVRARAADAIEALARAGVLPGADAALLARALHLYSGLQQVLRISLAGARFDPAAAPGALLDLLARTAQAPDFPALEAMVAQTASAVRAVFLRLVGPAPATEGG